LLDHSLPKDISVATRDLTAADFQTTVENNDIVLVDFWAEWCGPCRIFAPIYDEVSEQHTDVVFGKVDTEAEQQLAGAFGIRSIPTLMAFRDGIMVFSQAGALPAAALEDLLSQIRDLDMDAVREQLAAQAAS
jgi:thioredoxin 1